MKNASNTPVASAQSPEEENRQMTISWMARAAGIPTTTLRYYERCGLIMPRSRSASNYRLYGPETLRKLSFLRTAQAVGFALEDIATLLRLENKEGPLCQTEVRTLLEKRLSETETRLADLERVRAALIKGLERCKNSGEKCAVLQELSSRQTGEPKKKRKPGQSRRTSKVPGAQG